MPHVRFFLGAALIAATLAAQQTAPFLNTVDLLVADPSSDRIWRMSDLNLDGDWNDAGEVQPFFSSGNSGITATDLTAMAVATDGSVFVTDNPTSIQDRILRLVDQDGDGLASSPGEATVWFNSSSNASGVSIASAWGIAVGVDGVLWVASSNTTSGGVDAVVRLQDLNADGDANDTGEASNYAIIAPGGAVGESIPTSVVVASDGTVYFLENGTTTGRPRGIYRLHDDVIPNGNCNDPGEISPFYIPTPPATAAFLWGFSIDRADTFYVNDRGNSSERITKVRDMNADQTITLGGPEERLYYAVGSASDMWIAAVGSDGRLFVAEDQSPDRVYALADLDSNGDCTGPGEKTDVYSTAAASTLISACRSVAFLKTPGLALTPTPAPIGGVATLTLESAVNDGMIVILSSLPDNTPLPPYGTLGISLAIPGAYFELFPFFAMPAPGRLTFPFAIPNDPLLAGVTLYAQGGGGVVGRTVLSNTLTVTFQ